MITLNVSALYDMGAGLIDEDAYAESARALVGKGQDVILRGTAPVWLYLVVLRALYDRAANLWYDSPEEGPVLIFSRKPSAIEPGRE